VGSDVTSQYCINPGMIPSVRVGEEEAHLILTARPCLQAPSPHSWNKQPERAYLQTCQDVHAAAEGVGEQDRSGGPGHGTWEKQSLGHPVAWQWRAIHNVDGCVSPGQGPLL